MPLDNGGTPFLLGCANDLLHHLEQADCIASQPQGNEEELFRQIGGIGHGSVPILRQFAADNALFAIFEKCDGVLLIRLCSAAACQPLLANQVATNFLLRPNQNDSNLVVAGRNSLPLPQ